MLRLSLGAAVVTASAWGMLAASADLKAAAASEPGAHTFSLGAKEFLLDGKPYVIRCGEIHFARVPREYWRQRLQMCRAMGLNAVCIYLFWNFHEWEEGKFDWSGQADVAEFCRIAQEERLWVLLRPGPYSCAEWEMGGLPWWLLKKEGIALRTKDPAFLEPARRYLKEVGRVLAPMQITRGGPLLMVQVENEYGSFGNDADYMGALRQAVIDAGFEVPLFACNPPGAIKNGYREDLFQVVNFGKAPAQAFETLRKFQKTGPLMNGEYYSGWFDTWGRKHRTGTPDDCVSDLEYMLKNGMSFSIYMAHGGTSFGLWSGADRPFLPDSSSYDYDAPISEAGWPTIKFTRIRELFSKYLQPGETIPEPPAQNPVVAVPAFEFSEVAPIMENLPAAVNDERPRTMEFYDQSRGCMVYRTQLPAGPAGILQLKELHDFGWVFVDDRLAGVMDRRNRRYRVAIPARDKPSRLDIFVEAVGRVNFGREVFDRKGLLGPVEFTSAESPSAELKGWEIFNLGLDAKELSELKFRAARAHEGAGFWRTQFEMASPADTFLDLRSWSKGVVWVNGHCLGRFWNIGPTQTMYCPGPWLRQGANEIVVLDVIGPQKPQIAGLVKPILDQLRPELDFARRLRASGNFSAGENSAVAEGSFTPDVQWQEARFNAPAKGRFLCLEALDSQDGGAIAGVAELEGFDPTGTIVSNSTWKIFWTDSEEITAQPGDAGNLLDGQPATQWLSEMSPEPKPFPHRVVIDLGESATLGGIRYLPRSGTAREVGRIKNYRVYLSDKPFGLRAPQ